MNTYAYVGTLRIQLEDELEYSQREENIYTRGFKDGYAYGLKVALTLLRGDNDVRVSHVFAEFSRADSARKATGRQPQLWLSGLAPTTVHTTCGHGVQRMLVREYTRPTPNGPCRRF